MHISHFKNSVIVVISISLKPNGVSPFQGNEIHDDTRINVIVGKKKKKILYVAVKRKRHHV